MRYIAIENRSRARGLGTRIRIADSWFGRLRGFLKRPEPAKGEGLFIMPCRAVHTYGMSFPLDVAFLDVQGRIVAAYPELAPRRRSRFHRDAEYTLELPAGTLRETGTRVGDQLIWRPAVGEADESADIARSRRAGGHWRRRPAGSTEPNDSPGSTGPADDGRIAARGGP